MRSTVLIAVATVVLVAFGKPDAYAAGAQASAPAGQAAASSGSAGASSSAAERQQVVIQGQHELQRRVSEFVVHLTDFGDRATGMARWRDAVCPLVSGISQQQGDFVLARVSEIAQAAGAPLGGKKCRPNLLIMVTGKPQALLQDLVKKHRTLLFGDAPGKLIDTWVATSRPVRTWYDTMEKTPEGLPMLQTSFPGMTTGQTASENSLGTVSVNAVNSLGGGGLSSKTNSWSQPSHLTLNGVWTIYRVVEVVDATQLKGASLGQIADYVAMSGLAQLRQDASLGDDPTILRLFDKAPQAASPGLTDWDRAFLKSMYSTEQKSVLQRGEIAEEMVREISTP